MPTSPKVEKSASAATTELLREKPGLSVREAIAELAKRGVTATPAIVYTARAVMKKKKTKAKPKLKPKYGKRVHRKKVAVPDLPKTWSVSVGEEPSVIDMLQREIAQLHAENEKLKAVVALLLP